jgi:hypothetical protein
MKRTRDLTDLDQLEQPGKTPRIDDANLTATDLPETQEVSTTIDTTSGQAADQDQGSVMLVDTATQPKTVVDNALDQFMLIFNGLSSEQDKQSFLQKLQEFQTSQTLGAAQLDPNSPAYQRTHSSQSISSTGTAVVRQVGAIAGEVFAGVLGQRQILEASGTKKQPVISEKIHGRAGTNLSSGEGNHITASAVLNEIIYNFLEDKTPSDAIKGLSELAEVLGFDDKQQGKIKKALEEREKFLKENNLQLSEEDRYKLTRNLRRINLIAEKLKGQDLDKLARAIDLHGEDRERFAELFDADKTLKEDQIVAIKELSKYGIRAANAATIAVMSEEMVEVLNKQKNPPSSMPGARDKGGCHARDESGSMKNLRLFNAICDLAENYEDTLPLVEKTRLISAFQAKIKTIMQYSSPNISDATVDKNFAEFTKEFLGQTIELKELSKLNEPWINKLKTELKNENATYPPKIGEAFNNLFDFGYVKHDDEEEKSKDIKILYPASARHISYMFNAFSRLRTLPQTSRDKIIDKFFEQVVEKSESHTENSGGKSKIVWDIKGQGWGQAKIDVKKAGSDEKERKSIDATIIKSEVGKFLGDFQDQNYKLNLNPPVAAQSQATQPIL